MPRGLARGEGGGGEGGCGGGEGVGDEDGGLGGGASGGGAAAGGRVAAAKAAARAGGGEGGGEDGGSEGGGDGGADMGDRGSGGLPLPHPVWREAVGDQIRDVRRGSSLYTAASRSALRHGEIFWRWRGRFLGRFLRPGGPRDLFFLPLKLAGKEGRDRGVILLSNLKPSLMSVYVGLSPTWPFSTSIWIFVVAGRCLAELSRRA